MGFRWFEHGVITPVMPAVWSSRQHVQRLQHVEKDRKVADDKEEFLSPKELYIPPAAPKAYQKSPQQERRPAVHASQIMSSPVVTLTPETTVAEAWELIRARRFRHIPVLSRGKELVGIISDRDLLLEFGSFYNTDSPQDKTAEEQITIQGIIKRKVLTASPDTGIREIARILLEERIGSMPIVDDNGALVGIITRSDILRALVNEAPLELWI